MGSQDADAVNAMGPGNTDGTFPKEAYTCGNSAVSFSWTGLEFNHGDFKHCLKAVSNINSDTCLNCYVGRAEYGFTYCKMACMGSWCDASCLNCIGKYTTTLHACVGFDSPEAT